MHSTQKHLNYKVNINQLKGRDVQGILRAGDFNIPLSLMDRSSRKISKETLALNDMSYQIHTEHIIQKQQNTNSSQAHIEHS